MKVAILVTDDRCGFKKGYYECETCEVTSIEEAVRYGQNMGEELFMAHQEIMRSFCQDIDIKASTEKEAMMEHLNIEVTLLKENTPLKPYLTDFDGFVRRWREPGYAKYCYSGR